MRAQWLRLATSTPIVLTAIALAPIAAAKGKSAAKVTTPEPAAEASTAPTSEPKEEAPPAPSPTVEVAPQGKKDSEPPVASKSVSGKLPSIAFIEGGFRYDLGTFSEKDVVGRNQTSQSNEVRAFDPMLTLGVLLPLDSSWRMGAAFSYGFNYDPQNDNDSLGQLLALDGRLEWNTKATAELGLFAAPRVGFLALIPGGRLAERITQNQLYGYDTWNVPRMGFLLGAEAGARYSLNSFVNVRASLGYSYNMLFLMDSGASAGGVSASQNWQIQASRLGAALGVEVTF